MEKSRFRDQLSDYVENRLSPAERQAMDAYLTANAEARADLAALRMVWRDLGDWATAPVEEPPMFFRDNVLSAIERTGTRQGFHAGQQANLSLWQRWFPNAGRLTAAAAVGAALTGVIFFTVSNNSSSPSGVQTANAGSSATKVATGLVLPYEGQVLESDATEATPRLVISTGRTLTADASRACDFTFWLENAPRGSAQFSMLEPSAPGAEPQTFRYKALSDSAAQTLRIPYDSQNNAALALKVHWTAIGSAHDRFLFVPTTATGVENAASVPAPAFTLAEMPLMDALKEVTARTGVPITVEDVTNPERLRIGLSTDGRETVSVALRRDLAPLGLRVSRSPAGVLITAQ